MEKKEVSKREFKYPNGKKVSLVHYEWRFTDEEKENIKNILINIAPKDAIEFFLRHLEVFCNTKKYLLEQPQAKDVRENREGVLKDCKEALRHLKKIERGKMTLWRNDTLDQYLVSDSAKDPVGDFLFELSQGAWGAVGPLEKFIKFLEEHHRAENKKQGRKRADSDHFIKKLAEFYAEHIGKPSAYEDGHFFALVQTILEALDLPSKDPSRTIRKALSD